MYLQHGGTSGVTFVGVSTACATRRDFTRTIASIGIVLRTVRYNRGKPAKCEAGVISTTAVLHKIKKNTRDTAKHKRTMLAAQGKAGESRRGVLPHTLPTTSGYY